MQIDDFLYRGVIEPIGIRYSYAYTRELATQGVICHGCDPISAHLFARCLTCAVLLVPLLGDDERWVIRWEYSGLLKSILVEFGEQGDIRGIINPSSFSTDNISEQELFGMNPGKIYITQSTSQRVIHSGITEAPFAEPVADLEYFISTSHQIETALCAMVGFNRDPQHPIALAQGFMIQALPGIDLKKFELFRQRFQSTEFRHFIRQEPNCDNYIEKIIHALCHEIENPRNIQIILEMDSVPVWKCICSLEKVKKMLRCLSETERKELQQRNQAISIRCEFCGKVYTVSPQDWEEDTPQEPLNTT